MKKFLFLFCLLPTLIFGQVDPKILPLQISTQGSSADDALMNVGGTSAWVSLALNRVKYNYWVEYNGNYGIGTVFPYEKAHVDGNGATTLRVSSSNNALFRGFAMGVSGDLTEYGSYKMHLNSGEFRFVAGFAGWGGFQTFYTNGIERVRINSDGGLKINGLLTAGLTKNDASGNISTSLPTLTTSGANTTFDYSAQTAKHTTTDEYRIETGSAHYLMRFLTNGAQRRPQITGTPATYAQGDEWFNVTKVAPQWSEGTFSTDLRTAASIEKDVIGTGGTTSASTNFILGNNKESFFQVVDANSNAVTVTLDATMRPGVQYIVSCRRNGTNAITFTVPSGKNLDAQGVSTLNDSPFTAAPHAIYTVYWDGVNNYVVK